MSGRLMTILSLASIVQVHPEKVARAYARAYQPFRGYGANAHKVSHRHKESL